MRIEQRAWMTIENTGIQFEEGKPLIVQLVVRNTGKTPAKRVNATFTIRIIKREDSSISK